MILINYNIKNINKSTVYFVSVCKRTMYTIRSVYPLIGNVRYYPNQYSIGHFNYNARTGSGKKLPPHEYGHKLIKRNSDGQVVGALTTDPKNSFDSTLIDTHEYYNGKPVQNGEMGQYATAFNKPKIVENSVNNTDKPVFATKSNLQNYADKHEEALNKFYTNKKAMSAEVRLDKDDTRFYNENGTRDYENFP